MVYIRCFHLPQLMLFDISCLTCITNPSIVFFNLLISHPKCIDWLCRFRFLQIRNRFQFLSLFGLRYKNLNGPYLICITSVWCQDRSSCKTIQTLVYYSFTSGYKTSHLTIPDPLKWWHFDQLHKVKRYTGPHTYIWFFYLIKYSFRSSYQLKC